MGSSIQVSDLQMLFDKVTDFSLGKNYKGRVSLVFCISLLIFNSWLCVYNRSHNKEYLKQAVPIAMGSAVEEWQMDILTGFAGRISSAAVSVHTAVLQIFLFLTAIEFGILRVRALSCACHRCNFGPGLSPS